MLLKESMAAATLSGSALKTVKDEETFGTGSAARTASVDIPVDISTSSSVHITGAAETVAVYRTWVS